MPNRPGWSRRCSRRPPASKCVERKERFDPAEIAAGAPAGRREEATGRGVTVDADPGPTPANGDPGLAESLVANLVDNALRHNMPVGRVEIRTATVGANAGATVANTGTAIPPHRLTPARGRRSDHHRRPFR